MSKKRINAIISGIVQGVGYRFFAQRNAISLNLNGYVKNVNDDVEIVAEGDSEDLFRFIEILKQGPQSGFVEHTDVKWLDATDEYDGFVIKF